MNSEVTIDGGRRRAARWIRARGHLGSSVGCRVAQKHDSISRRPRTLQIGQPSSRRGGYTSYTGSSDSNSIGSIRRGHGARSRLRRRRIAVPAQLQVAIQYRLVAAHNCRSDLRLEVPQGARASLLQLGCAVHHVRWQRSAVGNLVVIVGVGVGVNTWRRRPSRTARESVSKRARGLGTAGHALLRQRDMVHGLDLAHLVEFSSLSRGASRRASLLQILLGRAPLRW